MKFKFLLSLLVISYVHASSLEKSVDITSKANDTSIASQKRIDKLVSKKDALYHEYKQLLREASALKEYNKELQEIIQSQVIEKKVFNEQINEIDKTQRNILPLIKNMLSALEELVTNDTPFLYKERIARIQRLKKLIKRSDVTIAAKYRAIIEAYEIENEYGRTIEEYSGILEIDSLKKSVSYLRIGRIALYYIFEDASQAAIWNNETKKWIVLDSSYIIKLKDVMKIASKKGVPNLLKLPLFKAKERL